MSAQQRLEAAARDLLDFIRAKFPDDFKEGGRGFICEHHRAMAEALAEIEAKA